MNKFLGYNIRFFSVWSFWATLIQRDAGNWSGTETVLLSIQKSLHQTSIKCKSIYLPDACHFATASISDSGKNIEQKKTNSTISQLFPPKKQQSINSPSARQSPVPRSSSAAAPSCSWCPGPPVSGGCTRCAARCYSVTVNRWCWTWPAGMVPAPGAGKTVVFWHRLRSGGS